jgi:hypothetical protein
LIRKKKVIAADASPHNIRVGMSTSDRVWYCDDPVCTAMIGSNSIYGINSRVVVLLIDFVEILRLSRVDGVWLLSLLVFSFDDELLLQIVDSELSYKVDNFDVQFEGSTLTLRYAAKNILFQFSLEPPIFRIKRGEFHWNGIHAIIKDDALLVLNSLNSFARCGAAYTNVAFEIGRPNGRGACFSSHARNRVFFREGRPIEVDESEVPIKFPELPNP